MENVTFLQLKIVIFITIKIRSTRILHSTVNGMILPIESRYEKTGFLHMRKQRRRSASL